MKPISSEQKAAICKRYDLIIKSFDIMEQDLPEYAKRRQPALNALAPNQYTQFMQFSPWYHQAKTQCQIIKQLFRQLKELSTNHPEGKYLPPPNEMTRYSFSYGIHISSLLLHVRTPENNIHAVEMHTPPFSTMEPTSTEGKESPS